MPLFIKHWVINFLINRRQVKLADILSGVPQGTKLRPWLFLLMINDLWSPQVQTWKYIDDTTISEVMPKCSTTNIHDAVDNVQTWSTTDRLQLNVAKYKELVISFSKTVNNFPSLNIDSGQLEVVMNARILGLTISNNLKWNDHMADIIKKANKPLYFIVQLKCTKVPEQDIITFYVTCVRPVLEYSCQVFHFALPAYLSDAIEWGQKHALAIIYPNIDYTDSLDLSGILKLRDKRLKAYDKLFNDIVTTPSHNLGHLQPERHIPRYNLRQTQVFVPPKSKDL